MYKTFSANASNIEKQWYVVDAEGHTLGRLAIRIAKIIRGKHKATYTPNVDTGDFVIVVNAHKVVVTGNKFEDKLYRHHTGYIGNLKTFTFRQMMERKPQAILEMAVKGMLPHNRLGRQQYKKLFVYASDSHPHEAQQPKPMP